MADGKLGKFGKILDSTPSEVKKEFGADPVKTVETISSVTPPTATMETPAGRKVMCINGSTSSNHINILSS